MEKMGKQYGQTGPRVSHENALKKLGLGLGQKISHGQVSWNSQLFILYLRANTEMPFVWQWIY